MRLSGATKVIDLVEQYPFLVDFLGDLNPKFRPLQSKVLRATVGRVATLNMVAAMGEMEPPALLSAIGQAIRDHAGEEVDIASGAADGEAENLAALRAVIQELHAGGSLENARRQFDLLLKNIQPGEIRLLEEQLVRQGMPVAEIQRLCDLHVGVFKTALDAQETVELPPGHPVHTYQQENARLQEEITAFDRLLKELGDPPAPARFDALRPRLLDAFALISRVELHYVRKENQLFPSMERHGIRSPTQVMWGVHNDIRAQFKTVRAALDALDLPALVREGTALALSIIEMIYKEEKILFPMVLEAFDEAEWARIRQGEDELGYIFVTPGTDWQPPPPPPPQTRENNTMELDLALNTGTLSLEQIDLVLRHLPVDISFVDENDEVRYYNDVPDRLFPRSPGVIGRKVQHCHPPKSMDMVQAILDAFRAGSQDTAEFWIDMQGRKLHIRYFAVRDAQGRYRGTLEVSQDITAIQQLTGQRRLLDWKQ